MKRNNLSSDSLTSIPEELQKKIDKIKRKNIYYLKKVLNRYYQRVKRPQLLSNLKFKKFKKMLVQKVNQI